jgi:hypothetical protein
MILTNVELDDEDQMDEEKHGTDTVEQVRERVSKSKKLVDVLRKHLEDMEEVMSSDGDTRQERMCTTQQTQVGPRVIFHRQNEE